MNTEFSRYTEYFPEKVSIRRKITEKTEKKNFHLHEQVEIVFAVSGNLRVRFEDRTVDVPKHSLLLLDSMNLHYIFSDEGSGICDRYVLYFAPEYVSRLSTPEINLLGCFLMRKGEKCVLLRVPDDSLDDTFRMLDRMEDIICRLENETAPFGADLQLQLLLGEFLLFTCRLYHDLHGADKSALYREHAALVSEVCEYIRENYRDSLNASSLAHRFSVSKTRLYSMFNEIFGIPVNEYVTDYRITRAKDLLINSTYSVEVISDLTGYATISSFSRLFKTKAGMSPLQYRKKYTQPAT